MKLGEKVTKSEWGLLILTGIFLCLMTVVLACSGGGTGADYTITPQKAAADVTPAEDPPVDLNTAGAEELDTLPGIGPVLAERIVALREERGGFSDLSELLDVEGIGTATLEEISPYLIVEDDYADIGSG